MARLTVTVDAPNWTVEQLQQAVAAIDEQESGLGEGIAPEFVTAWDILMCVAQGYLTLIPLVEDGLEGLEPRLREHNYNMHHAFDGVVVNRMED